MSFNIPIYVGYERLDKFKRKLTDAERELIKKETQKVLISLIDKIQRQ